MDDEEVDLTEEDHAYLIFLGTICSGKSHETHRIIQSLIEDEERSCLTWKMPTGMHSNNAEGDLDAFINNISEDYPEQDLLRFHCFLHTTRQMMKKMKMMKDR